MRAVVVTQPGGTDDLCIVEKPVPTPAAGEVLIKVAAAGVNRPDLMQRRGVFRPPPGVTDTLGLEVAGEVVACGPNVDVPLGSLVAALLSGGGYAEFCAAPAAHCLPVPRGLSIVEAAALPEAVFTVWHNLFELGRLAKGETVLVHGAASGIGTFATKLGGLMGAHVIATVGSEEKAEAVRKLGAARVVVRTREDFVAVVAQVTAGRGVDVVLDIVGGSYIARNLAALAMGGRHVSLSFLEGAVVSVDFAVLMAKSLTLTSSTLRPKSSAEKSRLADQIRLCVWPFVSDGRLRPVIHATFPLESAAAAHALMELNKNIGKVVLTTRTHH
jgi:putative PIG3 family NAD(P)H quinone oxidoreductase